MENIYLLYGADEGLKKDFIDQRLAQLGQEIERRRFYLGNDSLHELIDFLQVPSLFGGIAVAELRDVAEIKAEDLQQLCRYCRQAQTKAFLFLCSLGYKTDKRLSDCVTRSHQKTFWPMFENRKVPWLRDYCAHYGYQISSEAAAHLLSLVENDTQQLAACCELVMLQAADEKVLSLETVEQALIHTKSESLFSLFNCLMSGSLEYALSIVQVLRARGEQVIALFIGLQWQFVKLIDIQAEGANDAAFRGQKVLSKQAQQHFHNGCLRYAAERLQTLLKQLIDYDFYARQCPAMSEILLANFISNCFSK